MFSNSAVTELSDMWADLEERGAPVALTGDRVSYQNVSNVFFVDSS